MSEEDVERTEIIKKAVESVIASLRECLKRCLPALSFYCPDCYRKGVETVIDVTGLPDLLTCPKCGREFPIDGGKRLQLEKEKIKFVLLIKN